MKLHIFVFLTFLFSLNSFAQEEKRNFFTYLDERYTSVHTIGINANYSSKFSNEGDEAMQKGFAFETSSLHGFYVLKYFSLSTGLGLDFNVNKTFWSLPVLFDFRWYLYEFGMDNSPYFLLQMGKNIKIGDVFVEGRPVKLGLGVIFDSFGDTSYVIEIYKKSKEATFDYNIQTYDIEAIGVSLGIKF